MSRENYMAAANELGLLDDPTVRAVMDLLYASDIAYHKQAEEQIAVCKRVGEQLDAVPRMLVKLVTEGAP